LSIDLLSPLGASKAQKATVETFIEVSTPGTRIKPDGLIEVTFGSSVWRAFVEVKTGSNSLSAEQINAYWDLGREYDIDHVLTISNELAPKDGVHPTEGLKCVPTREYQSRTCLGLRSLALASGSSDIRA
jgi:hypothetical protein